MVAESVLTDSGLIAIGAGIAIGLAAIAGGIGQKDVLPAAIGAISENPKLFGKVIIFAVLPETVLIFGFVTAFLILNL